VFHEISPRFIIQFVEQLVEAELIRELFRRISPFPKYHMN